LVSEEPNEGDFYIEGVSLSGSGEGYGIPGGKETSPTVYFVLSILSEEEPVAEQTSEPEIAKIPQTENTTQEQTQEAPITGNVIFRFGTAISNFFLGLGMTGKAVVEFERETDGQVAASETFTYTLQEGERAELKPRSVRTNFGQLSDNDIELRIEGNDVIVTTNYSETGEGFGEDYLGSRSKEIVIDISNLGLILEQENLKISLIDSDQEIISLSTVLEEGEVAGETISEPESEIPEPEIIEEPEETEIYVPELIVSLQKDFLQYL